MSITKSYNKHTDTYYAYETTYEWDEARQKKVQRKRCIGKFNPDTGEVIPNGKVGRPAGPASQPQTNQHDVRETASGNAADLAQLAERCDTIERLISELSSEVSGLKDELHRIAPL